MIKAIWGFTKFVLMTPLMLTLLVYDVGYGIVDGFMYWVDRVKAGWRWRHKPLLIPEKPRNEDGSDWE